MAVSVRQTVLGSFFSATSLPQLELLISPKLPPTSVRRLPKIMSFDGMQWGKVFMIKDLDGCLGPGNS